MKKNNELLVDISKTSTKAKVMSLKEVPSKWRNYLNYLEEVSKVVLNREFQFKANSSQKATVKGDVESLVLSAKLKSGAKLVFQNNQLKVLNPGVEEGSS